MMVRVAACEDQPQTGKVVEQSFCGRQPARFRHYHIQNRYVRFVLLAKTKRFFSIAGAQHAIPQSRRRLPRHLELFCCQAKRGKVSIVH
jgi:hypothetical protein